LASVGAELILVSWIRDTPQADQKASTENGIDHWIGQVELGAEMIACGNRPNYPAMNLKIPIPAVKKKLPIELSSLFS